MNAAAKALEQTYLSTDNLWELCKSRRMLGLTVLFFLVIFSAFAVIYLKDINRRLISQLQVESLLQNEINVEHGKLLLEISTWATPERIEQVASERLQMQLPGSKQVIIVQLSR